jgi:hypothetical protein
MVRCWGNNYDFQCNTPADLGPCRDIAASSTGYYGSTIAVTSDGAVRWWGAQVPFPADSPACVAIATAGNHVVTLEALCPECPASLDGNCKVDGADLGMLLDKWGPCPAGTMGCLGDINDDGAVNGADLGYLLNTWGHCPN